MRSLGDPNVTREIFGNVPAALQYAFYFTATLACGWAVLIFLRRGMTWRSATGDARAHDPRRTRLQKLFSVVGYLTFHRELRRDPFAGTAHMLMFHGFFILFIGTCLVAAEEYGSKLTGLHPLFFYGRFYLISSLVIDLGGVAFLVGTGMFIQRRLSAGPTRILRAWWVAALSLLLAAIGLSGFLLEGARIARDMPGYEKWSVVGYGVAVAMRGAGLSGEATLPWHRALWATHAAFCVVFFALLPWGSFSHAVYGAASWANRTLRAPGRLRTPVIGQASPGAAAWSDMGWTDLLQADACTTCGRCNAVCPAAAADKPLRPREVVLGLRAAMDAQSPGMAMPGLSALIPDDVIWSCTTCGACNTACPVGIEVFDKIVELRRGRVEEGRVPEAAERVFDSTASRFNPFGKPNSDRMLWATGLDAPVAGENEPVEFLYWVGCAGSFDPDGQGVAQSMVKILNHLGVPYRVLGKRERCTGDPVRRMGEEGMFQELARGNINQLKSHGVRRVLVHCPHCFNTFKNEYPLFGGTFEVEHHSVFLQRMIGEGRLKLTRGNGSSVTFHDPCYLGRINGEVAPPRAVLHALPQLRVVEMPRSGKDSFCCGAGGGSMWLDVKGAQRVESIRAKEAAETGAATVATGCPFCKGMIKAGQQSLASGAVKQDVKDLAELIVDAEGL
ncbi:MAG: 4Fe-4S dicluster domain-containing protein [Planctomycetes bacterium]|nr:4Fe-4S dicluster domain-containing protein [Planctomycetota bacterium]